MGGNATDGLGDRADFGDVTDGLGDGARFGDVLRERPVGKVTDGFGGIVTDDFGGIVTEDFGSDGLGDGAGARFGARTLLSALTCTV